MKRSLPIMAILTIAFFLRFVNYSFPAFTSEEARLAYRGYSLSTYGKDELGRTYPLLFNSLEDYRLPVASYFTGVGIFLFGKSDLGARLPFMLIGIIIILLVYEIAKLFSIDRKVWFMSAVVASFSPTLIFLSRTPNETIILIFFLLLLLYLLSRKIKRVALIALTMVMAVFVSKQVWFILPPFIIFTLFCFKNSSFSGKIYFLLFLSIILPVLSFVFFINEVPQAKRSLLENNFSIFSDVTLANGINKLRGQGGLSGLPTLAERLMFNKADFLIVGLLHWLSNIQLSVYFAKFDGAGIMNFINLGAFSKVLIIPFLAGLFNIIRNGDYSQRALLLYVLIVTFPSMFIYPALSVSVVALSIPIIVFIIAMGLIKMGNKLMPLIIIVMSLEVLVNLFYLTPFVKHTEELRPIWVEPMVKDGPNILADKIVFSDDIIDDIVPFIQWYSLLEPRGDFPKHDFPYKFRQWNLANVGIIGSGANLHLCRSDSLMKIFLSKRDLGKIDAASSVEKVYFDSSGNEKAYLLLNPLCVD